jgi:hypothetical protein
MIIINRIGNINYGGRTLRRIGGNDTGASILYGSISKRLVSLNKQAEKEALIGGGISKLFFSLNFFFLFTNTRGND